MKHVRVTAMLAVLAMAAGLSGCKAESAPQKETASSAAETTAVASGETSAAGESTNAAGESTAADAASESAAEKSAAAEETVPAIAEWAPSHTAEDFETEPSAVTMRIALAESSDSVVGRCAAKFAELLNEYSGGTVTASIYPDSTLFAERELGMAVSGGYVQMTAGTPDSSLFPSLAIFEMKNVFSSMEYAHEVSQISSDFRSIVGGIYENRGVKLLALEPREYKILFSENAVLSASELAGLRVAIPDSAAEEAAWNGWSATPKILDFSDIYFALQQDEVDAQLSEVQDFLNSGTSVLQHYAINMHSDMLFTALMMNTDFYESLSENAQSIVSAAAADAIAYAYLDAQAVNEANVEKLKAENLEYVDFEKEDIRLLRSGASDADAIIKSQLGENTYGRLMAALGY